MWACLGKKKKNSGNSKLCNLNSVLMNYLLEFLSILICISVKSSWFYIFDLKIWYYKFKSAVTFLPFVFSFPIPRIASRIRFTEGTFNAVLCNMLVTAICKRSYCEQRTVLEVVQYQMGCCVPLRASQRAEQQIMGQIVDVETKEGRKLFSEGYENTSNSKFLNKGEEFIQNWKGNEKPHGV